MAPVPLRKPAERDRRRAARVKALVLALAVIGADAARAQAMEAPAAADGAEGAAQGGKGFSIQSTLSARLTYTDNARAGANNRHGRFIGELTPGLMISMPDDGGRIHGQLDVRLRNSLRASSAEGDNDRNRSFVALRGAAEVEAIRHLLFVDLDAYTNRSSVSSFSGRMPGDFLTTDATTETRMYSVGPRLQFKLGSSTDGSVRYLHRWLDSGTSRFRAQELSQLTGHLGNPNSGGLFGWALDYARNESAYGRSGYGDITETTSRATLFWNATRHFRVHGTVGHETNDYATGVSQSGTIKGGGFDWNPSPTTSLSASTEDRVFGRGYNVRLNYRRPTSTWSLAYVRDIASSLRPVSTSLWDEWYQQLFNDLAGQVPDETLRDAAVRKFLDQLGVPDDPFFTGALTNVHYLDKSLRAAVSLVGVRNLMTFAVERSDRERIGGAVTSNPLDDLARFNNVKQLSTSLFWNHELSGRTSLDTGITRLRAEGRGNNPQAEVRRWLVSVGVSSTLGARTVGSLTYRYQRATGSSDFRENVLTARVTMTF